MAINNTDQTIKRLNLPNLLNNWESTKVYISDLEEDNLRLSLDNNELGRITRLQALDRLMYENMKLISKINGQFVNAGLNPYK